MIDPKKFYLAHLPQFELLIADIKPHIITLVETWLNPDFKISFDNYTVIRRDRGLIDDAGRFIRGGGVACFIHKSLKSQVLYSSVSQHKNHPEFLIIDISPAVGSHILLSSIYRRPQGEPLNNFFIEFNKFYPHYRNVIITGDLNSNLLKSDKSSQHLKSFITDSALYCVPHGATYHQNGVDSWLDVIIVDSQDKIDKFSKSASPFIGGHDYLLCDYKLTSPNNNERIVKFRDFKRCDHLALSQALSQRLDLLIDSLNEFAPFTERKLYRQKTPWLTKDLKLELHNRDTIYKQARRTGNLNLLSLYKKLRSELKIKICDARDNYFKNVLEEKLQLNSGDAI
ncbi:Protein of unknown function [Cotesia congregata]|uniref:Endonuclease/exonuclease/phosphatase domain-containing protein n=1 Tax=Cotesia congregata TaxID=51543 RepID=A0A8J2EB83_COTCN|nr:Protein of unknown function [Cotesia congregata]